MLKKLGSSCAFADNELEFMTGEADFDRGTDILRRKYPNIKTPIPESGRRF